MNELYKIFYNDLKYNIVMYFYIIYLFLKNGIVKIKQKNIFSLFSSNFKKVRNFFFKLTVIKSFFLFIFKKS